MLSVCGCVSAGVFALLQVYAFLQYLKDRLTRQEFQTLFFLGVSLAAGMVFLTVIYLTYTGEAEKSNTAYVFSVHSSPATNTSSDPTNYSPSRYGKISGLVMVTFFPYPAPVCCESHLLHFPSFNSLSLITPVPATA